MCTSIGSVQKTTKITRDTCFCKVHLHIIDDEPNVWWEHGHWNQNRWPRSHRNVQECLFWTPSKRLQQLFQHVAAHVWLEAAQSSFRQRRAAGVVLLACCFHGSRATATRLHRGGYISISKPWRLVIKRHSRDWRRGSSSKKVKDFGLTGLVLIWHQEQGEIFTKKAFASYIKRFILKLQ